MQDLQRRLLFAQNQLPVAVSAEKLLIYYYFRKWEFNGTIDFTHEVFHEKV
jgi:hypothetical protein